MDIQVVHWRKEPYDVDIRRPRKWGNPFQIGIDGTRSEVIQKFHDWIITQPDLINNLHELQGKRLGCWCAPKPCHGDILKQLVEEAKYKQLMDF